jgi:hypothetical protein
MPVHGTEFGPSVVPVASGYLPRRLLLLFSYFEVTIIYTHIYKDIENFVPLHPCAPMLPTATSQGPGALFRHATTTW